jgi:predicted dithiol-disulfide oxidoreductase (DUF899 family)
MAKKSTGTQEIVQLEKQLLTLKKRLLAARKDLTRGGEKVADYTFRQAGGRKLGWRDLFGAKRDLLVIHNMGQGCPYCTLWADGFNGLNDHLRDRTAFWLVNNDPPQRYARFAAGRGWRFDIASCRGTSFFKDMGFERQPGKFWAGVSAFRLEEGGKSGRNIGNPGATPGANTGVNPGVRRIAWDNFGPGDAYCALWPLLDLLRDGVDGWEAKYSYAKK